MTQNTNPLADFYRNPKIYVALPSGIDYYGADVVEMPDIIPKSPEYDTFSIVSIEVTDLGSPIRTVGAAVLV